MFTKINRPEHNRGKTQHTEMECTKLLVKFKVKLQPHVALSHYKSNVPTYLAFRGFYLYKDIERERSAICLPCCTVILGREARERL